MKLEQLPEKLISKQFDLKILKNLEKNFDEDSSKLERTCALAIHKIVMRSI